MVGKKITENYSVEGQIAPEQVAEIAAAGFKTIMCNRPDGEEVNQPTSEEIRKLAQDAQVSFVYIPVVSGEMMAQKAAEVKKVLSSSPAPVFAYCRSGTRSAVMWALAESDVRSKDDIIECAAQAGYDISGVLG